MINEQENEQAAEETQEHENLETPAEETQEEANFPYIKEFLDGLSAEERIYALECLNSTQSQTSKEGAVKAQETMSGMMEEPEEPEEIPNY